MKKIHYILLAAAAFIVWRLYKSGATLSNPIPTGILSQGAGSFFGIPGSIPGTTTTPTGTEPAVYQPGNTDIKPDPGTTTESPPSSTGPVTKAFTTRSNNAQAITY